MLVAGMLGMRTIQAPRALLTRQVGMLPHAEQLLEGP
jgi:hypothetical protein